MAQVSNSIVFTMLVLLPVLFFSAFPTLTSAWHSEMSPSPSPSMDTGAGFSLSVSCVTIGVSLVLSIVSLLKH
ncbi:Meiosis arrest female protein [Quillaja saponaria]|uniref:Meiosis arrest female protein n=1 Tax=Quillaja saponaria TaxID=32244 RepID=A0AAD7Q8F3_QUISA|nr:Meiosis arrest female protein [Quillaja saponaria]